MLSTLFKAATAAGAAILVFLFVRRTPFRVRDDMPPRLRSAGIPEPDTRA